LTRNYGQYVIQVSSEVQLVHYNNVHELPCYWRFTVMMLLQSVWLRFFSTSTHTPSVIDLGFNQGSHYILVVKFKDFSRTFQGLSRTLKLHFQGPILDRSLQHEQYYSNI